MIKQKVGGKTVNTVNATMSDADRDAVIAILVGECEKFDLKFTGGTAIALPEKLNTKKFTVARSDVTGTRVSAYVDVPHVKAGKTFNPDISTQVIGSFDASFDGSAKCESTNLLFDAKA